MIGGLLNDLAEKGAYGDVRDFFSGDAHLLVEKRISGKPADNFLYFRVIGNFLIQRNGPGGFGKDGDGMFRGENDFRNSYVAQTMSRVAEQRACSEMTAGKHDMGMASENDVDIRRILHHFQIIAVSQMAEDDVNGVVVKPEPVRDALVIFFIRQRP